MSKEAQNCTALHTEWNSMNWFFYLQISNSMGTSFQLRSFFFLKYVKIVPLKVNTIHKSRRIERRHSLSFQFEKASNQKQTKKNRSYFLSHLINFILVWLRPFHFIRSKSIEISCTKYKNKESKSRTPHRQLVNGGIQVVKKQRKWFM